MTNGNGQLPPLPPQDLDAEKALIGSMLMSRDAIDAALLALPEADAALYDPRHAQLWRAVCAIHAAGQPIDYVVVTDYLRKADALAEVGGAEYTIELAESFSDWVNVEYYAKIVREKYHYRRCIQICDTARHRAYEARDDAPSILADAMRELEAIASSQASTVVEDARAVLSALAQRWMHTRGASVLTRFGLIDRHAGGFERPSLVVLGARPSAGKTSMALAFVLSAVRSGVNVLFVSLETTTTHLCERVVSQITERPIQAVRHDSPENQAHALRVAADGLGDHGKFWLFDYTRTRQLRDIIALCRAMARREKLGMIVVDYLQKIHNKRRDDSRYMEVTEISDALQMLAAQTGTCVLALAQLHRDVAGKQPDLASLRDSGAIEQDADMVLLLHRDEQVEQKEAADYPVGFRIAKWKDGPTCDWIRLKFQRATLRFFYQPNTAIDQWELIGIPERSESIPF